MKKEEFPTFLNEQPTVIFGRTGRELLVIVCGIVGGYIVWNNLRHISTAIGWTIIAIIITAIIVIGSFIVALVQVANRPLEEWFFCWLLYIGAPKVYLFKPLDEDIKEFEYKVAKRDERNKTSKKGKNRPQEFEAELFEED